MNNNNAGKNLDIITVMEDIRAFAEAGGYQDEFEFLLINHVLLDSLKRLALQTAPEKREVIAALRAYVRKNIPRLSSCESYRAEARNRRIVMWLNYHGMERLSIALLRLNGSM